ncbi:hypothetical protein BH93_02345 [Rhodococcoides fascians A25f]|nr:hypothetical protein [Rhodococcus fascians]QII04355.1 hypothetical protein BH93_02345 [Rhodococcus fascians A25f]
MPDQPTYTECRSADCTIWTDEPSGFCSVCQDEVRELDERLGIDPDRPTL